MTRKQRWINRTGYIVRAGSHSWSADLSNEGNVYKTFRGAAKRGRFLMKEYGFKYFDIIEITLKTVAGKYT
jgi:hypothetical protein